MFLYFCLFKFYQYLQCFKVIGVLKVILFQDYCACSGLVSFFTLYV